MNNSQDLKIPETSEELMDFFIREMNSTTELRDKVNKHIGDLRIEEFRERKRFLQSIVIASITLLGFVSAFLAIKGNQEIIKSYLVAGVASHLFLVCFVVMYLRESIDKDLEGLQNLQDRYSDSLESKIKIVEESLSDFIKDPVKNTYNSFKSYHQKFRDLPSFEEIKKENEKLNIEREDRKNNKQQYEFSGEIPVFCFVCGTIFIFLSTLGIKIQPKFITLGIILIFYLTFTDSLFNWLKYFFKVITFITRRKLF